LSVSNAASGAVSTKPTRPINLTNIILLVVLLAQIAVTTYLFWPSQAATLNGDPILAGVTPDAVTALTITDTDGKSVSFSKEGDIWTLADTDGYPARSEKISEILGKLVAINTDRLVTQTAGSHDRLQVDEGNYVRKVDITTASGTQTLYLGSSTGASATHVRAANADATYLTSEVATWELDTLPTTWIEVAYYQVPKEQITEVTLDNANGSLTFVRGGGENGDEWTLADATADEPVAPANINTLIDRIATLNLHTVLGKSEAPEYGLDAPLATLTVTTSEATTDTTSAATKTTTLVVGAKDEETNTYYLKSSDSEFYVRLAAFTGDEFVNKQRSDFMVQSTEATPDSSVAPEATEPAIGVTDVPTDTSAIESQTVPTATVAASETLTDTAEIESGATPTATVDASDVTTDTTAESETAEEPASTATPTN
jgi:hypothetical protein